MQKNKNICCYLYIRRTIIYIQGLPVPWTAGGRWRHFNPCALLEWGETTLHVFLGVVFPIHWEKS